jgi:hypothetical protein
VIPTAASAALTHEPSIGKDSSTTTDLGPIGEGSLISLLLFSIFTFNLASIGPLPDNHGNKINFNLTSYFKSSLDVEMGSPISLQEASHTTGGIIRGNAYGNKLNHADFEHDDLGAVMFIKPKQAFKIFLYVQYGDVVAMDHIPDFDSQVPITVFVVNDISPLTQPLLKKATQYHDSISRESFIAIISILN